MDVKAADELQLGECTVIPYEGASNYALDFDYSAWYSLIYDTSDATDLTTNGVYYLNSTFSGNGREFRLYSTLSKLVAPNSRITVYYDTVVDNTVGIFQFSYAVNGSSDYTQITKDELAQLNYNSVTFEVRDADTIDFTFDYRVYNQRTMNFRITSITVEPLSEQEDTTKSIFQLIKDFFGGFFDNLVNAIVGIFIPDSNEMKVLFDELNTFFSEKFGFLYYPFDFLIRLFDALLTDSTNTCITFPSFSIMGYQVWEDMPVDIAQNEVANSIFSVIRIITGAILSLSFVGYLRDFFDRRFGGGGN